MSIAGYLDKPTRTSFEALADSVRGAARLHRKMAQEQAAPSALLYQLRLLRQRASLLAEEADAEIKRIQGY